MKKFMAMYIAPAATIEMMMKSSPAEMKAGMDDWNAWMDTHKNALSDGGAPLGRTKRLTTSGLTDVRNEITGYSFVEAESAEAAAKIFDGHPHLKLPGASIDLLDVVDMSAMMAA